MKAFRGLCPLIWLVVSTPQSGSCDLPYAWHAVLQKASQTTVLAPCWTVPSRSVAVSSYLYLHQPVPPSE